ncbi:hypothetical protein ACWEKT_40930 [Nocardia takedensis]
MALDLDALAAAVAAHLGPGWSARRRASVRDLVLLAGPGEETILLEHGDGSYRRSEHGRLLIDTGYDPYGAQRYHGDPVHRITVADHRPAEQVAAEITTRLLPGYRVTLDGYRVRARRDAAAQAQRAQLVDQLAQLLAPVRRSQPDHLDFGSVSDAVSGRIRLLYHGDAELTLRISRDRILGFARRLADTRTGSPS